MRGWYFFILLVFIKNTSGINVGVGISDITGPAAEVGMVSEIKKWVQNHRPVQDTFKKYLDKILFQKSI